MPVAKANLCDWEMCEVKWIVTIQRKLTATAQVEAKTYSDAWDISRALYENEYENEDLDAERVARLDKLQWELSKVEAHEIDCIDQLCDKCGKEERHYENDYCCLDARKAYRQKQLTNTKEQIERLTSEVVQLTTELTAD